MKALRYLLIAFAAMTVLSVSAQSMAREPQVGFQSTSSMVGSGSTLPQAVQTGAYTTYDQELWRGTGVIKRVDLDGDGIDDDTTENEGDPNDPGEPFPIGDGLWALLFCAAVFSGVIAFRRKRQQRNV